MSQAAIDNGTLLPSAARTATVYSDTQRNLYGSRGVQIVLNVTVASGTGGLTLTIEQFDPASGSWFAITAAPTAVTATTSTPKVYAVYPNGTATATTNVTALTSTLIPATWRVKVTAGDSSSYTYSVGYSLLP